MKRLINFTFLIVTIVFAACKEPQSETTPTPEQLPNIVIIYLDDLGFGDLSCYGATSLKTPNIDALAAGGIRFTNGYASSATCTPSRYALLTGRYPWRKNARILPGTAPLLIDTLEQTIPKILKPLGYSTGIVGKWHLGLGAGQTDWNQHISPGPNEVGFDYSYILAATQDRVPTVYIENGDVVGLDLSDPILVNYDKNFEGEPTGLDNPELLTMKWHHGHNSSIVNGIPRIGYMKGGNSAKWTDTDMADHFLDKAKAYVKDNKGNPFFLYYAMQQPHVPRTPHPRFEGASGMGPRGDVIVEADWCVGEFMKLLEEQGILENTLVIFSSDNGPVLNDGYYDDAVEKIGNHKPAGVLRGGKYSLFDAGTHMPFITYWKGKISPGVSNAFVCQMDLLNSLAGLVSAEVPKGDGENLIDAFMGKSTKGRESLVLEANTRTAFKKNNWVMIPPYKGKAFNEKVNIELGNSDEFLLYDLNADPEQTINLAEKNPAKLEEMVKEFELIRGTDYGKVEKLDLK